MKRYKTVFYSLIGYYVLLALSCTASDSSSITKVNEPKAASLMGTWVVIEQANTPLSILPLCKFIKQGAIFKFSQDTLEVYVSGSGNPCDVFPFRVSGNTISFFKNDMVWVCTYQLSSDSLKLISNNFITPDNPKEKSSDALSEIAVVLKRK
ncbi:hypothetical protein [Rufibacter aurantiacus]|uniref:hypothetical protein n=1 Tax=Rufibacter aurantiacus TaxID=2817374 RepID=UPI001B30A29B|nr:hypothetical protein [Rufibacter aurantiacus]